MTQADWGEEFLHHEQAPEKPSQQVADSDGKRAAGRAGMGNSVDVMDEIGDPVACLRGEQGVGEPFPREAE